MTHNKPPIFLNDAFCRAPKYSSGLKLAKMAAAIERMMPPKMSCHVSTVHQCILVPRDLVTLLPITIHMIADSIATKPMGLSVIELGSNRNHANAMSAAPLIP